MLKCPGVLVPPKTHFRGVVLSAGQAWSWGAVCSSRVASVSVAKSECVSGKGTEVELGVTNTHLSLLALSSRRGSHKS